MWTLYRADYARLEAIHMLQTFSHYAEKPWVESEYENEYLYRILQKTSPAVKKNRLSKIYEKWRTFCLKEWKEMFKICWSLSDHNARVSSWLEMARSPSQPDWSIDVLTWKVLCHWKSYDSVHKPSVSHQPIFTEFQQDCQTNTWKVLDARIHNVSLKPQFFLSCPNFLAVYQNPRRIFNKNNPYQHSDRTSYRGRSTIQELQKSWCQPWDRQLAANN